MLDDYWDPDRSVVDRRPPDEEEFGSDTADRVEEEWTFGEPGDEPVEWSAEVETAGDEPLDQYAFATDFDASAEPARPQVSPITRAVMVSATAVAGAAAILVAVLRRRG